MLRSSQKWRAVYRAERISTIHLAFLTQWAYQSVIDRQTDGWNDRIALSIRYRALAFVNECECSVKAAMFWQFAQLNRGQHCTETVSDKLMTIMFLRHQSSLTAFHLTTTRPSRCRSHAHTVVWEWKDDRQSQWEMATFDPQPTLNPWTHRHQIWNTWLRRGRIPPKNLGVNPPRGFCPHMCEITQNLRMFTALFSVLPSPHRRARWTDFRV